MIGRLFEHALTAPERCAVASRHVSLAYAELGNLVVAQARQLEAAAIDERSVVGIECSHEVKHLVLCLAVALRGATCVTIPTFVSSKEREAAIESVGATHIVDESLALDPVGASREVRYLAGMLEEETTAGFLFSTSGTTDVPKIVMHTDSGLVAQAHRHVTKEERFACLASIEHNFAKRHRLYCVAEGATNVFLDPTPELIVEQCRGLEVTTVHLSVFQAQEFLAVPDSGALRHIRLKLGGSHASAELRQRLREGITDELCCGYGTTETGAIGFTDPNDREARESVGRALPGIEIRITDVDRNPVGPGERGEVAIRCEGMFLGYRDQPERTRAVLSDGWFHTGDTGYLDPEHRLHLCGRADDMFVFNGINIYPQDIEAQICKHPGVADAAVVPKASPVHGDVPVALVVFEDAATPDLRELKKFVRDLVGLRAPRQFTVVGKLPRNAAGKLVRSAAKSLLGASKDR